MDSKERYIQNLKNQEIGWELEIKQEIERQRHVGEYEQLEERLQPGNIFVDYYNKEELIVLSYGSTPSSFYLPLLKFQWLTGKERGHRPELPCQLVRHLTEVIRTEELTPEKLLQLDIENQEYLIRESQETIEKEKQKIEKAQIKLQELNEELKCPKK